MADLVYQGFHPDPNGRGTLGILFPCLGVLVLNAWALFHVNIPGPTAKLNRPRSWLHRIKIWFMTIIVPDGIATVAYSQWRNARRASRKIQETHDWWTPTHGFYAEMGGYRIRDVSKNQEYAFRSAEIAHLISRRHLTITKVAIEELDDRSNADAVVKALACIQSLWFLITTTARLEQGLYLTTLEIGTIPFIFITWWIYIFWWKKPLNIQQHTLVEVQDLSKARLARLARRVCDMSKARDKWWRPSPWQLHEHNWDFYWFEGEAVCGMLKAKGYLDDVADHLKDFAKDRMAIARIHDWYGPNVKEMHPSQWTLEEDLVFYSLGVAINLMLLIPWNGGFPTQIEGELWKAAVLTMIATATLWWPLAWLTSKVCKDATTLAKHRLYYALIGIYMSARFYVLVEPFVGLRSLPPSAYKTVSWSRYIPHLQ
ncbi:hypothetical protein G7054_g9032 [Neopestalotiopsis clavispora]|nr:hypothetical protein G7054_g9032 [Neopestalotiopsis clavispora]